MMLNLFVKIQSLLNREEGQGMVEYSLIIGLVAIAVVGAVVLLGGQIEAVFTNITNTLTGAATTTP